jgi:AraC family transcriptional regulator
MLARELDRWEESSPLLAEGACLELIARIARTSATPSGRAPEWLAKAQEFLRDTCADHIRIVDAAHAVGVHPVYFARGFRKFFGRTPSEYLNRCRAEKGAALLWETALPLADVALQAGFADQSHFSKVFKRTFGLPPGSYRRLLPKKQVQIFPFGSGGTRIKTHPDEILG